MTDVLAKALNNMVEKELLSNEDMLKQNLFAGIEETDSLELIMSKMVNNSLHISVQVSVQIIIELLINAEILTPSSDKDLRSILLSVVKD